jgi:hypothetical protein
MSDQKQEKVQKLANMLAEAERLFQEAAQYAGDNNVPLETVGYSEVEGVYFGGQPFELIKCWDKEKEVNTYEWYNSNCY